MKKLIILIAVCLALTSCALNPNPEYLPLLQTMEEEWLPKMEPMVEYPCTVSGTDVVSVCCTIYGPSNHQILFLDSSHDIIGTVGRIVTSTASTYKGTEAFDVVINGEHLRIN